MLAIIAMISDLPAMIAAVVEKLTGADLSGVMPPRRFIRSAEG